MEGPHTEAGEECEESSSGAIYHNLFSVFSHHSFNSVRVIIICEYKLYVYDQSQKDYEKRKTAILNLFLSAG